MLPWQQREAYGFLPGDDSSWSGELQWRIWDESKPDTPHSNLPGVPCSVRYNAIHKVCVCVCAAGEGNLPLTCPTTTSSTFSVGSCKLPRRERGQLHLQPHCHMLKIESLHCPTICNKDTSVRLTFQISPINSCALSRVRSFRYESVSLLELSASVERRT